MDKRIWKVVLGVFIVLTATAVVCVAGQRGGGGRSGFGGGGRGDVNRPFEIPQEFVDKLMAAIKEKNPDKAKELEALRQSDPAKFREQLMKIGPEEFKTIWDEGGYGYGGGRGGPRGGDMGRSGPGGGPGGRGQDGYRGYQRDNEEFLKFVRENFPQDANTLDKIDREKNPELYAMQFRNLERYRRLYDRTQENPQMKDLLVQDYKLSREQFNILMKIRQTQNKTERARLSAELEKTLNDAYSVKVKIKEKDYEVLRARLDQLKELIDKSMSDLSKWQNPETQKAEVKKQLDFLLSEPNRPPFWR